MSDKKTRGLRNEPNRNVHNKSSRTVEPNISAPEDPLARLEARNRALQSLHYSHNESRRLLQEMMDDIVEVLKAHGKSE